MTTQISGPNRAGSTTSSASVADRVLRSRDEFGDAVALRTDAGSTTFRELVDRAHLMRQAIAHHAVDPGLPVVVQVNVSVAAIALVLGVFLSRRPLVALDPALPAARVTAILDELDRHGRSPALYVADAEHLVAARSIAAPRLPVIALAEIDGSSAPDTTADTVAVADDPATALTSIQFTSGSTGTPKGVLHPNAMWLCDAELMRDGFGIRSSSRVALGMPISFGAGLNVLIGSLLNGAEVLAVDPRADTPDRLLATIARTGADVAFMTPSLLRSLVAHPGADGAPDHAWRTVRRIITTGEPLTGEVARWALARAPHATVTNWVGSSETSALAYFDVRRGDVLGPGNLPAGHPAPGKSITVDGDGRVVVASPYLALGYLDRTLDAGRFTTTPLGQRTFRMADRGEWIGDVLYLRGRSDAAVKIRGYLVDPSEIEQALLVDDDITEAVVVAVAPEESTTPADPSGTTLVAYVVPNGRRRTPPVALLRDRLTGRLPGWMVPAHIVVLSTLPRTARGKIDRTALPAPRRSIEPPVGHVEAAIAHIWARELRLDTVGRHENIYSLGADSLTVQKILVVLAEQAGVTLTLGDAAAAPTVALMAERVAARRSGARRRAWLPHRRASDDLAPTTVELRKGQGRTVFCFTGAGGSALGFVPFADCLSRVDGMGSVYAFAPNGLDNVGVPDWTVGAAVRRHLRDLRRIQPTGPYILVGHSLGGLLALEAAHRLRADGEDVEMVVVLDTVVPRATARTVRAAVPGLSMATEQPPLPRAELWRRRVHLPLAGLAPVSHGERAATLEEVGRRVAMFHRPKPYPGAVMRFTITANDDDPRLWSEWLTPGELAVTRLDCDHNSILRAPHVGRLVDDLVSVLNQV